MGVADIVKEWMDVREKSFKVETIQAAWYKSGINIFTAADFAPSISTSTQLHLPVGFPSVPLSDADDNITAISDQPGDPSFSASSLPTGSDPSSSTPSLHTVFTPPSIVYDYPQDHDEPPSDLQGEVLVRFYQAHIQTLQQKLNSGKGKKRAGNERNLSTTARMLTSAEGRVLAGEKRTAQLQKKAKDDENRSQRLLASAEVIKRRAELGREGMEFAGNIKSLKAPQLKDLAWSLELEENGTREVLIERILTHFGDDESLKVDKRYVELWRRRRGAAVSNDDIEQQAQPPEDMLMDIQNVASGSRSSSFTSHLPPPPPPPNAPYVFPDTPWAPPNNLPYDHRITNPPSFTQYHGNPPSDYYSVRHPYEPTFFRS
ncbi:hypothetical protein B0H14DRAFT_2930629 [Mycena olivaceomarginata]|nr:hypothetical protein B0H14DRAFT_2930629 [Mycena olivaceomarginata]